MDEKEERDPALDRAIELFKENEEITLSLVQRKCCVSYEHAYKILEEMAEMGYPVNLIQKVNPQTAELLKRARAQMFGRDRSVECSFQTNAPAQKCSKESIEIMIANAPQKREDMTVSLGEYDAFGFGTRVYVDYGKDIAYKRENSPDDDSYYLLSMDIPEFVRQLKEIVSSWEHELVNKNILDGMEYYVTFSEKGKEEIKYRGQNKFPENYRAFSTLLRALN